MSEELITEVDPKSQDERFKYWEKIVSDFADSAPGYYNFVERTKPHKAIKILMMLEQQENQRAICAACNVNFDTIRKVQERHRETIQAARKEFSRMFANLTEMSGQVAYKKMALLLEDSEDGKEALAKTSIKDIAIASGVWTDKGAMLDGMATQTIEVRRGASVSDAAAMIAAARERAAKKAQAIEAEVVS